MDCWGRQRQNRAREHAKKLAERKGKEREKKKKNREAGEARQEKLPWSEEELEFLHLFDQIRGGTIVVDMYVSNYLSKQVGTYSYVGASLVCIYSTGFTSLDDLFFWPHAIYLE